MRRRAIIICWAVLAVAPSQAQAPGLLEAAALARQGKTDEAIRLVTAELAARPDDADALQLRADLYMVANQPDKALTDLTRVIQKDPKAARAIDRRGDVYLKTGKMAEAIADFDRYLELTPRHKPEHWRRGIALYYAGRYKDGAAQFELHQTVNSSDVENAVWHYLCNAKVVGPEKARSALIPIRGDPRVPLMTVHALFAGNAKPDDVLKEATAGNVSPERKRNQLFYAHLYLGLYFDSAG